MRSNLLCDVIILRISGGIKLFASLIFSVYFMISDAEDKEEI